MLAGIVEQAGILRIALLDDVLEALALQARAFQQLVAVGDIGLMVLVVVVLEGFLRHVGLQRLVIVRQGGKFKSHFGHSSEMLTGGGAGGARGKDGKSDKDSTGNIGRGSRAGNRSRPKSRFPARFGGDG